LQGWPKWPHISAIDGEQAMNVLGRCLLGFALGGCANVVHAADGRTPVIRAEATPEVCTEVYQPVCGTDANGRRVTYSNACFARMAKATNVTEGECPK
jgi:hypothetical protein